ncbi:MAG TPA: hypothetical protein VKD91_14025 [Pyrinomonadaceae bacterium]|nr:hypothetical protein [Pyrinomonadaceae bacterium]
MNPADRPVPPGSRYVFINKRDSASAQHPSHLVQDDANVCRMMQHVAEQHCVERAVIGRKHCAVVAAVIDRGVGRLHDIDAHHWHPQHCAQVMGDEAVAATDIQDFRSFRNQPRNLERHVVGPADLAAPSLTPEAASKAGQDFRRSALSDGIKHLQVCASEH